MHAALIVILLFAQYAPPNPGFPDSREYLKKFVTVQYRGTPKVPKNGVVKIVYKDFYPGDLNWKNGGCTWLDKTKPGSIVRITYGPDWESAKGIPGHTLEYECHWSAPK